MSLLSVTFLFSNTDLSAEQSKSGSITKGIKKGASNKLPTDTKTPLTRDIEEITTYIPPDIEPHYFDPLLQSTLPALENNVSVSFRYSGKLLFIGENHRPVIVFSDEVKRRKCISSMYGVTALLRYGSCRKHDTNSTFWEDCALNAGLDPYAIDQCARRLQPQPLSCSIESGNAEHEIAPRAPIVPTLYLGDLQYHGQLKKIPLLSAMCSLFPAAEKAAICNVVPRCHTNYDCLTHGFISICENSATKKAECAYYKPVPLTVQVIAAEHAIVNQQKAIENVIERNFPGTTFHTIDEESQQAKKLITAYQIKLLPAFIFPSKMKEAYYYEAFKGAFIEKGNAFLLHPAKSGASFLRSEKYESGKIEFFSRRLTPSVMELLAVVHHFVKEGRLNSKNLQIIPLPKRHLKEKSINIETSVPSVFDENMVNFSILVHTYRDIFSNDTLLNTFLTDVKINWHAVSKMVSPAVSPETLFSTEAQSRFLKSFSSKMQKLPHFVQNDLVVVLNNREIYIPRSKIEFFDILCRMMQN